MPPRQFGEGPLSRASAFVYTLLVVQVMLSVASLPGLVPLLLLAPVVSNIPLAAACAIPFGPALSAAVYALHRRSRDLADLKPCRQFWHGYRLNWRAVLPVWLIGLLWLTIVILTIANFWIAGIPGWWAVLLAIVGVLALLWLTNALVITSLFDFRTRDALRLSWELIPRLPLVTLGNAGVLLGVIVLAAAVTPALVGVLAVLFVQFLVVTNRPMIVFVTEEFTE